MATIVISTNTSLDGVVQDPDGSEGFRVGGWFPPTGSTEHDAQALLLGRQSYEFFSTRWAARAGAWADRLNDLPKYVVSSSLSDTAANWGPTTVLRGDVVDAVSTLKRQIDGDVVVYASYQLGQTLIEHDLVDELRLIIQPWVLGDGQRLFGSTTDKKPLRLVASTTAGRSLALLTYQVVHSRQATAPKPRHPSRIEDRP